ncbi:TPA: hypothetical protein OEJ27_002646 [Escherichia coli]|nr:hypothetical protein [Escherichia coli]
MKRNDKILHCEGLN